MLKALPLRLMPLVFPLLFGAACTEYELTKPGDVGEGDDELPWTDQDDYEGDRDPNGEDGPDDPDEPWDNGDPDLPPEGDPPQEFLDGCEGVEAEFSPGEIYVLSWDRTEQSGTLWASEAGWFHLYDLEAAESGASQTNETAFIRVRNSTNPEGTPAWSNCGLDWIVVDADNHGTPTEHLYAGTFWLDQGDNDLTLYHYCALYRQGYCEELHITDPSDRTCDTSNVNSVHLVGEGLCVQDAARPQ